MSVVPNPRYIPLVFCLVLTSSILFNPFVSVILYQLNDSTEQMTTTALVTSPHDANPDSVVSFALITMLRVVLLFLNGSRIMRLLPSPYHILLMLPLHIPGQLDCPIVKEEGNIPNPRFVISATKFPSLSRCRNVYESSSYTSVTPCRPSAQRHRRCQRRAPHPCSRFEAQNCFVAFRTLYTALGRSEMLAVPSVNTELKRRVPECT